MKKLFCVLFVCLVSLSFAGGPYTISIGSGDGSLAFTGFYRTGYIAGDDGLFNPGGGIAAGTTVWNQCWCFSSSGSLLGWADKAGFSAHTSKLADGTIAPPTPTGNFTNTGITFPGSVNITADLAVNFSAPVAGNTAQVEYIWTLKNSTGGAIPVTILWFIDGDIYIGGDTYSNNVVALSKTVSGYTVKNALGIIAQGLPDPSTNVDLNKGFLMDCDTNPSCLFGLSNANGPSYFWSNTAPYYTGPEATSFEIGPSYKDTVENDAGGDFRADTATDVGGCMQVDVSVPATGQTVVKFYSIWGLDTTVGGGNYSKSGIGDWALY